MVVGWVVESAVGFQCIFHPISIEEEHCDNMRISKLMYTGVATYLILFRVDNRQQ